MSLKKQLILMFAPAITILFALLTFYTQYSARQEALELAYTSALSIAADQSSSARTRILNVETYLVAAAGEVSEKISEKVITNRSDLKNALYTLKAREGAPTFFGIGLIIPEFDGKNSDYVKTEEGNAAGQFAGYLTPNESGKLDYAQLDGYSEKDYFKPTYTSGKTYLTDAYKSALSDSLMVTFSAPIKLGKKVIGVIFIDINLNTLSKLVSEAVIPYAGGYAFLATDTGAIVGHPKKEALLKNLTSFNCVDKTKIVEELKSHKVIRESGVQSTGDFALTLIYPFKVTLDPSGSPWYFGLILPEREAMAKSNDNLYKTIGISAVGILIALAITFFVANTIANSVQRISNFSSEISKGDYNASVSTKGFTKELLDLKNNLASMVKSLLAIMNEATESKQAAEEGLRKAEVAMAEAEESKAKAEESQKSMLVAAENIESVSTRLSTAAEQLSAQVEESSRSADQQREQVGVSVNAMEQMNSTVLDVAQNASKASEGSENTKRSAEEGANIVRESISSIKEVEDNVNVLQEEMEGLGKQAESIGTIMTVISDIADQTNLLALNAAIEAARAGEAGRGFAVVADEVRKLAEKTMDATGEVGKAVNGIQQGMIRSVSALGVTATNISKSTELVAKSGDALAEIVDEAIISAEQISSIAAAVEEQSASCQNINDSLLDINRISDEVATVMQESSQAVMDLSKQATELEDLVSNLRKS